MLPNRFFALLLMLHLLALPCVTTPASAQRIDFTYPAFGVISDADNIIENAIHLEEFFGRLHQLRLAADRRVSIVHIGDSHLQADYLTAIVRRNFHRHFGNAGRGLVVPLRVAGTNEPNNYRTASNVTWRAKRCVFPEQPLPIGVGGVTIETADRRARLDLNMNDLWLDYSFNSIRLFYERDEKSFDFSVRDKAGRELARFDDYVQDSTQHHTTARWEQRIDGISLHALAKRAGQSRAILYGAVLENGSNGVLYHTIGVNGARYRHYNEARHFAAQTAALQADLFIISLGTNESADYPNVDRDLDRHIDKLLSTLRAQNPRAAFLLVTPQDAFRKKDKPNPGVLEVRSAIIRYAVENGLAFYDLYKATGGADSAQRWRERALMSTDGIHLTKDGYEHQGNLLYHAIMKGYNSYVPDRHP